MAFSLLCPDKLAYLGTKVDTALRYETKQAGSDCKERWCKQGWLFSHKDFKILNASLTPEANKWQNTEDYHPDIPSEMSLFAGGLDEALYTIINTCREQGVPFVFALSRKALGRCLNKAVPVSLVGIFNYDGAQVSNSTLRKRVYSIKYQKCGVFFCFFFYYHSWTRLFFNPQDIYHKMIELSSKARRAYEVMVSNLEQSGLTDMEQEVTIEGELQVSSLSEEADTCSEHKQPEEAEYSKSLSSHHLVTSSIVIASVLIWPGFHPLF